MNKVVRLSVYFGLIVIFLVAINSKITVILDKKNMKVDSIESIWNKEGRPVDVELVVKSTFTRIKNISSQVINSKRMIAYITKDDLREVKKGQHFEFTYQNRFGTGKVSRVSRSMDINTGLFQVYLSFDKKYDFIKKEDIVLAAVTTGKFANSPQVQTEAVIMENGKHYVWIIKSNKAEKREVKLGLNNGKYYLVESGLDSGDKIIIHGQQELRVGDSVKVYSCKNCN